MLFSGALGSYFLFCFVFNAQEAAPLETRMKGKNLFFIFPQFPYSAVADRVDVISEEYQMIHMQKYDQICPLILLFLFFKSLH